MYKKFNFRECSGSQYCWRKREGSRVGLWFSVNKSLNWPWASECAVALKSCPELWWEGLAFISLNWLIIEFRPVQKGMQPLAGYLFSPKAVPERVTTKGCLPVAFRAAEVLSPSCLRGNLGGMSQHPLQFHWECFLSVYCVDYSQPCRRVRTLLLCWLKFFATCYFILISFSQRYDSSYWIINN